MPWTFDTPLLVAVVAVCGVRPRRGFASGASTPRPRRFEAADSPSGSRMVSDHAGEHQRRRYRLQRRRQSDVPQRGRANPDRLDAGGSAGQAAGGGVQDHRRKEPSDGRKSHGPRAARRRGRRLGESHAHRQGRNGDVHRRQRRPDSGRKRRRYRRGAGVSRRQGTPAADGSP